MVRSRVMRRGAAVVALLLAFTGVPLSVTAGAAPARAAEPSPRADFDHLIGRQYRGDTVPVAGWRDYGGQLLSPAVGFGVYRTPQRRLVFVSGRIVRRTPQGIPVWAILDTATTSAQLGPNSYWAGTDMCRKNGSLLPNTIGLAGGTNPYWNPARQLWNITVSSGRLTLRSTAGVTCSTGNPH